MWLIESNSLQADVGKIHITALKLLVPVGEVILTLIVRVRGSYIRQQLNCSTAVTNDNIAMTLLFGATSRCHISLFCQIPLSLVLHAGC